MQKVLDRLMNSILHQIKGLIIKVLALSVFYLAVSSIFVGKVFVSPEDAVYQNNKGSLLFLKKGAGSLYFLFEEDQGEMTQLRLNQNWSQWESNQTHWKRLLYMTWGLDCFQAKFTSWCCESSEFICRESSPVVAIMVSKETFCIENEKFVRVPFDEEMWRASVLCQSE